MVNRAKSLDDVVFNIEDLKREGSLRIPKMYRDYFNEGAMALETLMEKEAAYKRYKIRPRVLVNVDKIDTSAEIFGIKVAFPLRLSPTAMHKLAHPDGEIGTSRAAAAHNIAMGLSSYSTSSMEDVIAQSKGNPYFVQMCILKNRDIAVQLVRRAEAAGYKALFLSVDVPALGRRLNEMRNNFILPEGLGFPNILSNGAYEFGEDNGGQAYDATVDWENSIGWLRKQTKMQIWLKGINTVEDVQLAIKYGVDGVLISNHGGRQLDGIAATLDTLRVVAPTARGKIRIAVDGGVRSGADIFKALALGAEHVFVGRIAIWGLGYKGQKGVELGIKLLQEEFAVTMRLAGCTSIKDITPEKLAVLGPNGILAKL